MHPQPPAITLSRPTLDAAGLAMLGARWHAVEAASDPSPFQTWTWVGCNAAERFPDPLLIEAHQDGQPVGIALCNRRRLRLSGDTLWLHESGDPALDAVFTEHNAPLIACRIAAPDTLLTALLLAALQPRDGRLPRLAFSGVGDATRAAALRTGRVELPDTHRAAPYVDFAAIAPGTAYIDRITAGASVVGYLYNLVRGGRVCAYQSGLDYPGAGPHGKPGLTCHHAAIKAHRARGGISYDFLGGADRYKRSLANAERTLHWLSVAPPWHPATMLFRLRRLLSR